MGVNYLDGRKRVTRATYDQRTQRDKRKHPTRTTIKSDPHLGPVRAKKHRGLGCCSADTDKERRKAGPGPNICNCCRNGFFHGPREGALPRKMVSKEGMSS